MRPAEEAALEQLRQVGIANVANALYTRGFSNVVLQGVAPLTAGQEQLVGPAYTLRFVPAREDLDSLEEYAKDSNLHRRAIEEAPAGSVLVIDAHGSTRASSMGDMMATRLRRRGVAGVVTDGGYRDAAGIAATGLPCYQAESAPPATPIALHPVALDEPVGCAGVAIYPNDIIVGDRDGVVVVPRHLLVEVAQAAYDAHQYEQFAELQIRAGRPIFGLFPATPESRIEYDAWVAAGRPHPEESA